MLVTDAPVCNIDEPVSVNRETDSLVPVFTVELPGVSLGLVCSDDGNVLGNDVPVFKIDEPVAVIYETDALLTVFANVVLSVWF